MRGVLGAALSASLILLLLSGEASAAWASYTFVDLHSDDHQSEFVEAAGAGYVVGSAETFTSGTRASMWHASGSVTDLHPPGMNASFAMGAHGNRQVGVLVVPTPAGGDEHAALWNGAAQSFVDLHPAGYTGSAALAIFGDHVGGNAYVTSNHAMLWNLADRQVTDLHPAAGFTRSFVRDVSGNSQVGDGTTTAGAQHALLWRGTSAAVDLNPPGFISSVALAASETQQGGRGAPSGAGGSHAILWNGSASDFVDLHPAGYLTSEVKDISGEYQIGAADSDPILWHGSATDFVNLRDFIPADGPAYSHVRATAIDSMGNIYGQADGHAVVWIVPEPGSALLSAAGLLYPLASRRRRR